MTFGRIALLAGVAMLVMVANVLASVLYMVVYSHWINPGHDEQYYQAHIKVAAPYCSIVAGIPLMFLAGRWIGGWWAGAFAVKAGLIVWATYALVDFAVLAAMGLTGRMALIFAISMLTKLAAVYGGALSAARAAAS